LAGGVIVLQEGAVARVRLNRPERRNALDDGMIRAVEDAFASVAENPAVRVVLIDAEGDAFCAGADLEYMQRIATSDEETNRQDALRLGAMFAAMASCPHPVVALVRGPALGGGAGLVAAADIAIAEAGALFGFTEVRLGLIPAVISPFVLRKVHPADVRRYFLTGERFSAAEALRIGLVQILVEPGQLDLAAGRCVAELLAGAPRAQGEVKALLDTLPRTPPGDCPKLTAAWIARLRASEEGREGMRAFLERKPAPWDARTGKA
jgi:methylglutaconyl-CoA hydratase